MACAGCSSAVESALSSLEGAENVQVSHTDNSASLKLRTDSPAGEEDIRAAVEKAGYKVTALK